MLKPMPHVIRIHWLTWVATLIVGASLLFVNLASGPDFEHGWPWPSLGRVGKSWTSEEPEYWMPWSSPVREFSLVGLLANGLLAVVLILGTGSAVGSWVANRKTRLKLTSRALLATTAWIASGYLLLDEWSFYWTLLEVAKVSIFLAIGLSWFSAFDIANGVLSRPNTNSTQKQQRRGTRI
jgi:hypothetical protein